MKVRQCDRCKKILSQNKIFSYTFDVYDGHCFWSKEASQGDFCFSCYEEFEKFLNQ